MEFGRHDIDHNQVYLHDANMKPSPEDVQQMVVALMTVIGSLERARQKGDAETLQSRFHLRLGRLFRRCYSTRSDCLRSPDGPRDLARKYPPSGGDSSSGDI